MAGGALPRPESAEEYLRLFDVRDLDDRPLRLEDVPAVRAARGEAVSGAQIRWYTPDGPKVITIHAARIAEMFGHPETVLIAFDDITNLKEVHAQLEEAVRVRQDFLVDRGPRAEDAADVGVAESPLGGQGTAARRARGRPALRGAVAGAPPADRAARGAGRSAAGCFANHRGQDGAGARADRSRRAGARRDRPVFAAADGRGRRDTGAGAGGD